MPMPDHKITVAAALATVLASLALYPIFDGPQWFWSGCGAVIAVALAGTLTRMRRLPPLVCFAGGVAGLLLYLNLRFEAVHSFLGLIPLPGSLLDLWHLAGQGMSEAGSYAPPVPPTDGMLLLASGGIGITTVLTDLLAVRLRSTALAGLPLLMLFTEPFAVTVTRSATGTAIVFCLAAAGYLALLSSDGRQRIRAWGRIAGPAHFAPDTSALATAGRRVGIASVVVALCVPLLLPGLHPTRLFQGTWTFGGVNVGNGSVSLPSPFSQLQNQLTQEKHQTVLTYRTSDPEASTQYLQEYVMENLTSQGWTWFTGRVSTQAAEPRLPAAPGLNRSRTIAAATSTTITFSDDVSNSSGVVFLPIPYPTLTLDAPGSWSAEPGSMMVLSRGARLASMTYKVSSLHLEPSTSELNDASAPPANIARAYEAVPASYRSLLSLAESITSGDKTELDKALSLEEFLSTTGGFSYTLDATPVTNASSLTAFLDTTKRGYCEQFAFAMSVLARLLHIPARYAVGYTAGERQPNGTWVVKTSDAHAWPELYFSGVGWIRFEPTPSGDAGQGTATSPAYAVPPAVPGGTSTVPTTSPTTPAAGSSAGSTTHPSNVKPGLPGQETGGTGGKPSAQPAISDPWAIAGLVVLGLFLLGLILPGLGRLVARRVRWRGATDEVGAAHAAWRQFRADLTDHRAGGRDSETPRALARRLCSELALAPGDAAAVRRLAMAAERARYSDHPAPSSGLREDTVTARRAVTAASSRSVRWRARLFPGSILIPLLGWTAGLLDLLTRARLRLLPWHHPHPSET